MKTHPEDSRQAVDRFLGKLGEPLAPAQVERVLGRVRERLEEPPALNVSINTSASSVSIRWIPVAATILVRLAGGLAQLLYMQPGRADSVAKAVSGQVYLAGVRPLSPLDSHIKAAQSIRTGAEAGTIELRDGSRIEMSPQAELSVVPAVDGMSVRLSSGTVIVTAAKQRDGHLYVETSDLVVSVVGTVFSVSAEKTGSRVSVIEGEVKVQQGSVAQTLTPGQQASTSPTLGPLPVETELRWSKSAGELAALMEQQAAPVVPAAPIVSPVTIAPQQSQSRVIQGSVKLASRPEGIEGVTVTVCPAGSANSRATRMIVRDPNAQDGYTITFQQQRDPAFQPPPAAQAVVPQNAPIVREKAYFFALWDGNLACARASQIKTDAAGRFQIADVSPGEYVVRAELEGYFGPAANGTYPAFASQNITVDAQQTTPEVSLSMVRGGSISGRVRDSDGKLAVNVSVSAGVAAAQGNVAASLGPTVSRATDDRGEYRLFGLPPGEYYVAAGGAGASAAGVYRYFVGWNVAPAQAAVNAWIASPGQTFFPNGSSLAEGKTIVLREGEEVVGVDITMRPAPPTDPSVAPGRWIIRP
jgi:hypothetical protein